MPTATVDIREIAQPPLREAVTGAGLCRTCVNAPECTFPRDPRRPVRSCDEFEGAHGPRSEQHPPALAVPVFPTSGGLDRGTTEMKGLCAQCARRHTCVYPKPAGGVWHCDELV
jgi:hypothetical protein